MKKYFLLCIALLFVMCSENKIDNPENVKYLRFDFQYGYNNSLTKLCIDNKKVFEESLTTNDVLSLAEQELVTVSKGAHTIKCSIDSAEADTTINIPDSLVVGIHKNHQTGKVGFSVYQVGSFPFYD